MSASSARIDCVVSGSSADVASSHAAPPDRARARGQCRRAASARPTSWPDTRRASRRPDEVEQRLDLARALGLRHAGDLQRQRDVLEHRLRGQQVEMLEHHAGAPPQRRAILVERADIDALHAHAAARPFEAVHEPQKRRLAGAAAADDPETSPRRTSSVTSRSAAAARRREHLADLLQRYGDAGAGRFGRRGRFVMCRCLGSRTYCRHLNETQRIEQLRHRFAPSRSDMRGMRGFGVHGGAGRCCAPVCHAGRRAPNSSRSVGAGS